MTIMPHALLPAAIARCLLIGLLAAPSAAFAEPPVTERSVKVQVGKDVRVAVFASIRNDCTPGQLPTIKLKLAPTRGKITIKNGKLRATNLKHCLAVEAPALFAIYRADSEFSGNDVLELEVIEPNGQQKVHRLTISIGSGSAGARDI
jgi:hypothetical protein